MTPQPQQHDHPWTDVPALQRMREDLEQVTARDARAQAPRRRPGPQRRLGLALAGVLAAVVVGITLVAGTGDEAVADLRDAPQALLEAGRYAYTTTGEYAAPGQRTTGYEMRGEVDLKAGTHRFESPGRAGSTNQVVVTPDDLYTRMVRPGEADPPWTRSPLSSAIAARQTVPVSLSSVRALRRVADETIVARNEDVDGIATTHYRVPMTADEYVGLRGAGDAELRDVRGTLDIWLDADDLPRRVRASFAADDGRRSTVDTRYERFGRTEPVRAPAASRLGDEAPLGDTDGIVSSLRNLARD